jgi:hypothetical protein
MVVQAGDLQPVLFMVEEVRIITLRCAVLNQISVFIFFIVYKNDYSSSLLCRWV